MFAFALSLAAGTSARAAAAIPCAAVEEAASSDLHYEGDADEVAADEDGGYPHHHGVGHDHGVGLAYGHRAMDHDPAPKARLMAERQEQTAGAPADPALRPPTA